MSAVAALSDHPGFRPKGEKRETAPLLVPSHLAEEDGSDGRRPRVRRQAGPGRALGNAIDPWPFIDAHPSHPGYGLTPKRVLRIFRESEDGYLAELQDLYDDLLESDGHLRSLFEGRVSAVSGKGRVIQAGGDDDASKAAAEALDAALEEEELDLVEHFEHQLEAPFRGYSATEIVWEMRDGLWAPVAFDNIPHRRFRFRPGENELRLAVASNITHGEELWPDKWVISKARHSNLARGGLLRTATWWSLFKRLSVRDWIIFAEKFGIPHTFGLYDENASEETKKALEQALKDIGEAGQAILSKLTEIRFESTPQASGDAESVHPAIVKLCDAEISKLINGATLTVESGGPGSFALGRVHENRAYALELADAMRLQRIWRRYIARPFIRFNGFKAAGAKPPKLNIQIVPELDPKTEVQVMSMLVNELGLKVDGWHVAERLGFRRPTRDEDAAVPMKGGGQQSPASSDDQDDENDQADQGGNE